MECGLPTGIQINYVMNSDPQCIVTNWLWASLVYAHIKAVLPVKASVKITSIIFMYVGY